MLGNHPVKERRQPSDKGKYGVEDVKFRLREAAGLAAGISQFKQFIGLK